MRYSPNNYYAIQESVTCKTHRSSSSTATTSFSPRVIGGSLSREIFTWLQHQQPDILFVSNERSGIIEDYIFGAPDLVIEILSPSTADRDRRIKLSLYARFGVREYWIIDPEQNTIQVIELETGGQNATRTYTSGSASSALLPGLDVPLDEVFAN